MPQATVKHFDPETASGSVLLDDTTEVPVDAETFAVSGLEELRLGQRVRVELDDDAWPTRVTSLRLISI